MRQTHLFDLPVLSLAPRPRQGRPSDTSAPPSPVAPSCASSPLSPEGTAREGRGSGSADGYGRRSEVAVQPGGPRLVGRLTVQAELIDNAWQPWSGGFGCCPALQNRLSRLADAALRFPLPSHTYPGLSAVEDGGWGEQGGDRGAEGPRRPGSPRPDEALRARGREPYPKVARQPGSSRRDAPTRATKPAASGDGGSRGLHKEGEDSRAGANALHAAPLPAGDAPHLPPTAPGGPAPTRPRPASSRSHDSAFCPARPTTCPFAFSDTQPRAAGPLSSPPPSPPVGRARHGSCAFKRFS
jgi:hypothetical protein